MKDKRKAFKPIYKEIIMVRFKLIFIILVGIAISGWQVFIVHKIYAEDASIFRYYPLKVGNIWKYEVGGGSIGGTIRRDEVLEYLDKYNAYLINHVSRVDISVGSYPPIESDSVVEVRGHNILKIASSDTGKTELKMRAQPEIILQGPLDIGRTWKYSRSDAGDSVKIEYKILSFVDYKVKAGSFKNVCKIERKQTVKLDGELFSWSISNLYYAPNIGLIAEVAIKNNKSNKPQTILELAEYKIR